MAREVGINLLGSARALLGSLDKVKRVVKVLGMVNSAEGFGDQPKVINGFSDLMVEVFGENGPPRPLRGGHGRAAHGHPRRDRDDPRGRREPGRRRARRPSAAARAASQPGGPGAESAAGDRRGARAAPAGPPRCAGRTRSASLPSTRWMRPSRTAGMSGIRRRSLATCAAPKAVRLVGEQDDLRAAPRRPPRA